MNNNQRPSGSSHLPVFISILILFIAAVFTIAIVLAATVSQPDVHLTNVRTVTAPSSKLAAKSLQSTTQTVIQNHNGFINLTNPDLGVTFTYASTKDSDTSIVIQNNIYLLAIGSAPSVTVLPKDKAMTLSQAIQTVEGLQAKSPNCYVKTQGLQPAPIFQPQFEVATVSYKAKDGTDAYFEAGRGIVPADAMANCVPAAMNVGSPKFFLYDPAYPNKFLFVSLGQAPLWANQAHTQTWEQTIKIINNSIYIPNMTTASGPDKYLFQTSLHDFTSCINSGTTYCAL